MLQEELGSLPFIILYLCCTAFSRWGFHPAKWSLANQLQMLLWEKMTRVF